MNDMINVFAKDRINFPKYINSFLTKNIDKKTGKKLTRNDIAIAIKTEDKGSVIRADTIKKIINNVGYTTNRDRIIMICSVIGMDSAQTSNALKLYGMAPLFIENNRDNLINVLLNNHLSLSKINQSLINEHEPPLSFKKNSKTNINISKVNDNSDEFKILESNTFVYKFTNDESLSEKFNPSQYAFKSNILLYDGEFYHAIEMDDTYDFHVHTYDKENKKNKNKGYSKFSSSIFEQYSDQKITKIKRDFGKYLIQLENQIDIKKNEFFIQIDDTKFFHHRINIEWKDNNIHIFVELYNYESPFDNEYYQMDYYKNKTIMTVTNRSIFLKEHLGKDYNNYYQTRNEVKYKEKYTAQSGIKKSNLNNYKKIERENAYKELIAIINDSIFKLVNGKIKIHDSYEHFDDRKLEIAQYYSIDTNFKWIESNEDGTYHEPKKNWFLCKTQNGKNHKITIDDLFRIYDIGIYPFNSFISIINEFSSIDDYLKNQVIKI